MTYVYSRPGMTTVVVDDAPQILGNPEPLPLVDPIGDAIAAAAERDVQAILAANAARVAAESTATAASLDPGATATVETDALLS